jgi:hypothetical protein
MNIKEITVRLAALVTGVSLATSAYAVDRSCQAPIVPINDTNVCSQANINYVGFFRAPNIVGNRLERTSVRGTGLQTEARDSRQNRFNPRCRTAINRTVGREATVACTGVAFHQTFIVPPA